MKIRDIYTFLFGTLRGRLILGVAVVVAVIMSLFIMDLTVRQRSILLDRQEEEATALAQSLSTSASAWLAADDIAGLQELVEAQESYPELVFAILVDERGRVLADTDKSKQGLYLSDLPAEPRQTVMEKTPELVDVTVPSMLGGSQVGWARVGIGQKTTAEKLAEITRSGILYALAAIVIGSVIAWLMGFLFTRRLYAVQEAMNKVHVGDLNARASITGTDEAAGIAREFNTMLDALSKRSVEINESAARFRKLFNVAAVPLCFFNKEGVIIDFNDRFEKTFGYTHEDIPTLKEWWQLAYPDPDYRQWVVATWEAAVQLASEEMTDIEPIEYQVTCKSGEARTIVTSGTTIDDDFLATFFDITERKRTEEEIKSLSQRNEMILNSAGEGIYGTDIDGNIVFVNPSAARMLGYETQEMIGKNSHQLFHHTRADGSPYPVDECPLHRSLKNGEIYRGEEEVFWTRDGDCFDVEHVNTPLVENGKVVGAVIVFRDITERKQAEVQLRSTSAYTRSLIEASLDPLVTISAEGKITDVNQATEEMTGRPKAELIGTDFSDYFTEPEKARAGYKQVFKGGFVRDYPLAIREQDGQTRDVLYNASLYQDESGNIAGVFAAARDITERKRLEQQLVESQKMEIVGRLAGGVAHDFNNLLTAIEGYIDLADTELPPGSPAREDLAEARAASDRAANLARQLLLFGRRESIEMKPVHLSHTVSGLLKMLGGLIGERYNLKTELEEELWSISADTGHMEQVLMNLVVNARDAMPEGGTIVIRTRNVNADPEVVKIRTGRTGSRFVALSVSDSGIGMDEQTRSKIFEPFFTTKEKGKGTGLGLSVVYGIVIQHGGWIDVDSAPAQGSNFSIYFPAIEALSPEPGVEKQEMEGLQGKGERVLLVEDEESIRKMVERMLSSNGYVVEVAADAESAMDIFEREKGGFSLVFSDVILPGMDGVNLCESLLRDKPDLRVLLASGYSDVTSMKTVHQKGYRFLHKPYDLKNLLRAIREELEKQR